MAPQAVAIAPAKVYSKESEHLVKKSWEILKKDAQCNGINFFRKVFEIAPGAKSMYSFLRDSTIPFEENPKVKNHARYVFLMTGDAAIQLGEKGTYEVLDSKLHKLATTHVNAGVTDDQFEIVKTAILYAIEMGVPQMWSPELKAAWGEAYDMIADALKAEMRAQRASAAQ
jgi:hemoglobin-like flavoprotein